MIYLRCTSPHVSIDQTLLSFIFVALTFWPSPWRLRPRPADMCHSVIAFRELFIKARAEAGQRNCIEIERLRQKRQSHDWFLLNARDVSVLELLLHVKCSWLHFQLQYNTGFKCLPGFSSWHTTPFIFPIPFWPPSMRFRHVIEHRDVHG